MIGNLLCHPLREGQFVDPEEPRTDEHGRSFHHRPTWRSLLFCAPGLRDGRKGATEGGPALSALSSISTQHPPPSPSAVATCGRRAGPGAPPSARRDATEADDNTLAI